MATFLLWMAADAPAAADASNGPVVVIVTAILAVLGTIGTAFGPALVELIKGKVKPATPPAAAPTAPPPASPGNPLVPVVASGIDALSMVDAAVRDSRAQRDAALQRADLLQSALDSARATIGQHLVEIAQLRGRLARYEPTDYPGTYGRPQPMTPPQTYDPYRDRWSS